MDGEDVTARSSAEDLGELSLGSAEWPLFGPHSAPTPFAFLYCKDGT
jgi:hypothetical protein